MPEIRLAHPTDFEGWRDAARRLAFAGVPPEEVAWRVGDAQGSLFDALPPDGDGAELKVPLRFLLLARQAVAHADPGRFALLYRVLWRLGQGERGLLKLLADEDVARLEAMVRAVRRAGHRMEAFLRFKEVWTWEGPRYVGWFEPEHYVLELCASFFTRRFTAMRWLIVTPYRSASWDGSTLLYGPGGVRTDVPAEDARDEDWRAYYASVFNPARLNPRLMQGHMPKRYWKDLPETRFIPRLVAEATPRAEAMVAAAPTAPTRKGRVTLVPHPRHAAATERERPATVAAARESAMGCKACPLWEPATRTVFGEGPEDARVMLVGEQPGDWEDLEGRPFVGPAGQLLDRALAEAGLDRSSLYLTNAVKHFKFAPRGKRRLHQRPDGGEIAACAFWLEQEQALVRPKLTVALGATAARALLGREVRIGEERGRVVPLGAGELLVTAHPSSILRQPDAARQAEAFARLAADLRLAAPYLAGRDASAAA